jgi:hypothetical protein
MPLLSVLIYPEWVPCLDPIASQLDPHKESGTLLRQVINKLNEGT